MKRRTGWLVGGVIGSFALSAGAQVPPPAVPTTQSTQQELVALRAEMKALEAKEARLEAAASLAAAAAPPSAAVGLPDQTKSAVLEDSVRRSSFMGGYDPAKGFVFRSDDGNFSLHPWVHLQFRNVTNYQDRSAAGDTDLQNGFEVRRLKLGVDGTVFSPDTSYLFIWQTDRSTGDVTLEEAALRTKIADDFYLRGGQFKDPFAHESLVSSKRLLGANRSLLTDAISGGDNYIQGASIAYSHGPLQAEIAITDGFNEPDRNALDYPTNAWDFGVAGRVQYKFFGDWSAYDQFTTLGAKKDLLVVGAGADCSQGGDTTQVLETVDAQYDNLSGLGMYAALYGRSINNSPKGVTATPATETDTFDWGGLAQASYLIPQTKFEPYVRYDYIGFDTASVAVSAERHVHEFTGGVNYYLHGQAARFTIDATYLPDGTPIADLGSGISVTRNSEFILALQLQFVL